MQQPHKWIWGLIPVAVLWLLAGMFQTKVIEQDLGARSNSIVAAKEVLSPAVSVKGRDVTVSGTRLSDNGVELVSAIEALNGVRLVRNDTRLIEEARPYSWSLKHDGGIVTLSGSVPDPDVRGRLLAGISKAFAGAKVIDQTTYARGKSGDLGRLAESAFGVISPLAKGAITIVDGVVSVSGEAPSSAAFSAAMAAARSIPAAALGKVDIAPQLVAPFTFAAEKTPNQIVLTGFYPDEKTHAELVAQAKSRFLGVDVVDRMELGRGAPAGFPAAASFGLGQLSRLETGTATLTDSALKLSGVAQFDKAAQQIKDVFASALPKGFTGTADLNVKQAPAQTLDASACQAQMMDLMGRGRILFGSGDAAIADASRGLLDALVFTANSCSASQIIVTGHTDSSGQADANLELSKRRAQAVADYLVASGIAAERVHAVGFGQTRPIASNDTEEGKALNRRIEFTVQ